MLHGYCCLCHAGARLVKLLFTKYVLHMCWAITLHPQPQVHSPESESASSSSTSTHSPQRLLPTASATATPAATASYPAVLTFLASVTDQLQAQVQLASHDLAAACRRGYVHGTLLTLRYVCEDVPWAGGGKGASSILLQWLLQYVY